MFFQKTQSCLERPRPLLLKLCQVILRIRYTRKEVQSIRQNGDFDYNLIANMDETPVYMDMVPSKTLERGKNTFKSGQLNPKNVV